MAKILALDTEMVGSHNKSLLARVSIVDMYGDVIFDHFVKPTAMVTDYRSFVSGINESDLKNGLDFQVVKSRVANLIKGCILVGHSLHFDLEILGLSHPKHMIRDLATYPPFLQSNGGQPVSLQTLASKYLRRAIQTSRHDSREDAKACMDLYQKFPHNW